MLVRTQVEAISLKVSVSILFLVDTFGRIFGDGVITSILVAILLFLVYLEHFVTVKVNRALASFAYTFQGYDSLLVNYLAPQHGLGQWGKIRISLQSRIYFWNYSHEPSFMEYCIFI